MNFVSASGGRVPGRGNHGSFISNVASKICTSHVLYVYGLYLSRSTLFLLYCWSRPMCTCFISRDCVAGGRVPGREDHRRSRPAEDGHVRWRVLDLKDHQYQLAVYLCKWTLDWYRSRPVCMINCDCAAGGRVPGRGDHGRPASRRGKWPRPICTSEEGVSRPICTSEKGVYVHRVQNLHWSRPVCTRPIL